MPPSASWFNLGPDGRPRRPYLLIPWLEIWVRLADEKCRHGGLQYVETSLDRDHRRSKCLYQCSTCRCHSTGTSPAPTMNSATPSATMATGCTIGSSLRRGSSSGRPGRPEN